MLVCSSSFGPDIRPERHSVPQLPRLVDLHIASFPLALTRSSICFPFLLTPRMRQWSRRNSRDRRPGDGRRKLVGFTIGGDCMENQLSPRTPQLPNRESTNVWTAWKKQPHPMVAGPSDIDASMIPYRSI
jgi:hypothetical protein